MFKVITKREIAQNWVISKTLLKNNRLILSYIISNIKNTPYEIGITQFNNILTISYRGKEFGLSELLATKSPKNYSGGLGKKVLTNTDLVDYKYENGINIWTIKHDREFTELVNKNKTFIVTEQSIIVDLISYIECKDKEQTNINDLVHEDHVEYTELCKIVEEIVTNIVYYTNITTKGSVTLLNICILIKYYLGELKFNGIYQIRKRCIRKRKR